LLIEAVDELDRELTRIIQRNSASATPAATIVSLRRALHRVHRASENLLDRVLDSATELTADRFESAYRARTVALQIQFQALEHFEAEVAGQLWPAPGGRFQSLAQVRAHVFEGIGRANDRWFTERGLIAEVDPSLRHRALINAVAKAERELLRLGKDDDLACFLAAGAALSSPGFRRSCRIVAALLSVPLAPDSRKPSLAHRLVKHRATYIPVIDLEEETP
jgi:hypothetical protein